MATAKSPRGPALREALVAEAAALIEAEGLNGFNTRALADTLGITQPALYRHFESREALLRQVTVRGFVDFNAYCLARAGDDDPYGRLTRLGGAYVRFAVQRPGWFRLTFGRRDGLAGLAEAMQEVPAAQALALGALARVVSPEDPSFGASYRVWWGLVHGLSFLTIERVFSLVSDDDARIRAAEEAIAEHATDLRARRGEPGPPTRLTPWELFTRLRPVEPSRAAAPG